MTSISKLAIKNLNDRLLSQNIIIQTLIEVILESGLVTEQELESKIEENIENANKLLGNLQKESSDISEELEGFYFGPVGEA